ncbi:MAG: hypothetical protein ACK4NO_01910 [Glycocaulis sp.]
MTRKPDARPAEGGRYIRQSDGSLKRAEDTAVPEQTAEKTARKTAAKPAVKED